MEQFELSIGTWTTTWNKIRGGTPHFSVMTDSKEFNLARYHSSDKILKFDIDTKQAKS